MQDYIIAESYTLPSKGMVYEKDVNPDIKIRSMTTNEEMKRLSKTDSPYKMLTEIIDDCLVEKPGISTYDMCIGDYQFLLHKLRVVTYGSNYPIQTICPLCGAIKKQEIDLESLEVTEYSDEMSKHLHITLPQSKKEIELRLQSPRMLDENKRRAKELLKKSPNFKGDPAFLYTLESVIKKVDGEVLDPVRLEQFVRSLPMKDSNFIIKSLDKINIGINTTLEIKCDNCGVEYKTTFPYSEEFFGPSID